MAGDPRKHLRGTWKTPEFSVSRKEEGGQLDVPGYV
jgi:hypothetical protein